MLDSRDITGTGRSDRAEKHITVTLVAPRLHIPGLAVVGKLARVVVRRRPKGRRGLLVLLVAVAAVGSGLYCWRAAGKPQTADTATQQASAAVQGAYIQKQTPDFTTILPAGKTIDKLGGWGRVSPPDKAPVFAYSDRIGGTHANVSEQQLPDSFQADPSKSLAKLGQQLGGDKAMAGDTVVYIANPIGGAAQSVTFIKKGLLLFIRSAAPLTTSQIIDYVKSLQ